MFKGRNATRDSQDGSSGQGSRGRGGGGGGISSILSNLGGGGGGGGGGRMAGIGRSLLGDNPIGGILENVNFRNITSNLLSSQNNEPFISNNNLLDHSVKFNPLVYYNSNNNASNIDYYKKNLIENAKSIESLPRYYQRDDNIEKFPPQYSSTNQNWSYYRINNDNGYSEFINESNLPTFKTSTRLTNDYHTMPIINNNNQSFPKYSRIPITSSHRDKAIQTGTQKSNNDSYSQQYASISPKSNKYTQSPPNKNDITMYSSYTQHVTQQNNRFRKGLTNLKGGIVLNPATSLTSIYNHESNTDESIEFNNNNSNPNNLNNNQFSQPSSMTYNNLDSNSTKNDFSSLNSISNNNDKSNNSNQATSSTGAISISINSKNGTASILSNPTHKELPRHDTFYFNESVKL
jgi:hypothetical protein